MVSRSSKPERGARRAPRAPGRDERRRNHSGGGRRADPPHRRRSASSTRSHNAGQAPDRSAGLTPGLDIVYGRNPVREALRGRRQVHSILLARGGGGHELERSLPEWCGLGRAPPVRHMEALELTERLRTPDHQGVAAEVDPYPYVDEAEILAGRTLLVALDGVQDPHNLGAVIRTAEGAGAGVIIPRHRAVEVTPAVVKASAGATEHAAVAQVRNMADFLEEAKKAGFWVYGTAAGATGDYTEQDYSYPTVFVLGSEGEGVGHRVESLCDVVVALPLVGRVESLNVSVSAGILLYEALRQRAAGEREDGG